MNDKLKLRKRLLNRFSVIAFVSILLTAVFLTAAFWFVFANQEQSDLQIYSNTVARAYNADSKAEILNNYSSRNIRITLIASDGSIIFDSSNGVKLHTKENHSDRPEFMEAIKNGHGSSRRMSSTINSVTYYYAVKTNDGNILRASKTVDSTVKMFARIFPAVLLIMIFVFIICIAMSKRSTRKIIEPIENMSKNLDDTPYDELVPLAQTISSQQKEIKKQIQKLQIEKDKINTLIQNMSEGFILIDMDKNVLMSNHSAAKLIGANDERMIGKSLISYSRNDTVLECVESALNGEGKSGDLTINGRVLQIMTSPVYSNSRQNGVICLIIDVSAKKKAEKMRREFTANVTHELKTPLTSISGYAEIIASGLARPNDVQGFAKKIHKESGRLLSLIGDIIELSQLDESTSSEEFVPVDLSGVAYEVAEDLRSNAAKQGIDISVDAKKTVIKGDRNQIYELVYNLCDNAIRYNRPNGKVKITVTESENKSIIKVADTGIGIPQKHWKRIFERFYRVDKSRSKETGGTGLGLAIVKHIAEHHGGTVTLESNESGTTFTVQF